MLCGYYSYPTALAAIDVINFVDRNEQVNFAREQRSTTGVHSVHSNKPMLIECRAKD